MYLNLNLNPYPSHCLNLFLFLFPYPCQSRFRPQQSWCLYPDLYQLLYLNLYRILIAQRHSQTRHPSHLGW